MSDRTCLLCFAVEFLSLDGGTMYIYGDLRFDVIDVGELLYAR